MKKILLIFLLIPSISFAQDPNVWTTQDLIINAVLENTGNYLNQKNDVSPIIDLKVSPTKQDSIDWNRSSLNKWQIVEPKDSLKTTYDY